MLSDLRVLRAKWGPVRLVVGRRRWALLGLQVVVGRILAWGRRVLLWLLFRLPLRVQLPGEDVCGQNQKGVGEREGRGRGHYGPI